jgi:hypothetical protein
VLWIVATAMSSGFVEGRDWTVRADHFGQDKPYAFSSRAIVHWAQRWKFGSTSALFAEARRLLEEPASGR